MRTLHILLGLAASCAPNTPQQPALQRPSPETGGIQATQGPLVHEWVELGSPAPSAPLQQTLQVPTDIGPVSELMIKGLSGESRISQILVQFSDQREKTIDMKKILAPGDGQVIELRESQRVSRITVFVEPESTGTLVVLGAG